MAMAPCPECNKKISTKAATCPHCGHPIDDASRAAWIAEAKRSKRIGCGFLVLIFLVFLTYCSVNDSRNNVGYDQISKTWDTTYSVKSWESGPLFGGTAVLLNDFAGYWLKDNNVYVCNGVAMGYSPGAPSSPPSVDQALIEKAVKGNAPAMPPAFAMTYTDFIHSMLTQLDGAGFKKSIWSQYEAPGIEFHVKEAGGQLTEAGMGFRAEKGKMELPLRTMVAFFKTAAPGITDGEISEAIRKMLGPAVKNLGAEQTAELHGAVFALSAADSNGVRYVDMTATPVQKE